MKTIIFRNADSSVLVSAKVDIHASNAEILSPNFVDTRFTAMEIADDDAAKILGIDVKEVEQSVSALKAMTMGLSGIGMFMIDQNDNSGIADVTLEGTDGTANVVVDGVNYLATFNTDLETTTGNFVTAHAAALLALGVTVTSVGTILRFEGAGSLAIVNATLTLTGSTTHEITLVPTTHA